MAKFLFCAVKPVSLQELKEEIIFQILTTHFRFNIPKTVYYTDIVISILEEASQYKNLLINVQIYNRSTLGLEIINDNVRREILTAFILDEGVDLWYTPHISRQLEQLSITQDKYRKFMSDKMKEINLEG